MLTFDFWILSHLSLNSGTQILIPVFCFQIPISSFESLDQTNKKLKLTSVKSIHFKPMHYLQRIATSNTPLWIQNRFWEESKTILPRFQCLNFSLWILSHLSLNLGTQILIPVYVFHLDLKPSLAIRVLCFNPVPLLFHFFFLCVFICNICS